MEYPKEFSVVLFLFLVVIAAYFVTTGRIASVGFAGVIVASAVAVAILHNLDTFTKVGMKSAGVEANIEVTRQLRDEVFAKAVEVQRLAEQTAAMNAWVVSTTNRFAPDDFQEQLLRRRDELRSMLSELGVAPERQAAIVLPITRAVANDYRAQLRQQGHRAVVEAVAGTEQERLNIERDVLDPLSAMPNQRDAVAEVRRRAAVHHLVFPAFVEAIERYVRFLDANPEVVTR